MDSRTAWESALPDRFAFYHLGEVVIRPHAGRATPELQELLAHLEDRVTFAYTFEGEARGLLLAIFEKSLDPSTYAELGNILASRMADALSRAAGGPVMISSPKLLSEGALRGLVLRSNAPTVIHRSYTHVHGRVIVPIEALVIPIPSEGIGNA